MMITDIKDKFAGLRIYGYFNTACDAIVDRASDECHETCEKCGGHNDVKINHHGWMYCYCAKCRYEENIIIDVEEDENIDVSNIETQTIKIDKIL